MVILRYQERKEAMPVGNVITNTQTPFGVGHVAGP